MDRRNVMVGMAASAAAPAVAMIPVQALGTSPSLRDRTYTAYKISALWNELITSYQEVDAIGKIPDIDGEGWWPDKDGWYGAPKCPILRSRFSKALDRMHKVEGAVRSFALSKEV